MKLDPNLYRSCQKLVNDMIDNRRETPLIDTLSLASIATGIPVAIVYTYAIEKLGPLEELKSGLVNIISFYGYEEIR